MYSGAFSSRLLLFWNDFHHEMRYLISGDWCFFSPIHAKDEGIPLKTQQKLFVVCCPHS